MITIFGKLDLFSTKENRIERIITTKIVSSIIDFTTLSEKYYILSNIIKSRAKPLTEQSKWYILFDFLRIPRRT
jgi:hypothetical protein